MDRKLLSSLRKVNQAMFNPSNFPRQRWSYPKEYERNYVASFFHATSITLLSTALIRMVWFRTYGGADCTPYLMLSQFFTLGYIETKSIKPDNLKYPLHTKPAQISLYHSSNEVLTCVTPQVVFLIRLIIMLCLTAIFSSSIGFCLDLIGPKKKLLRIIRQNGLPSIFTVLLIVAAVSTCYLAAASLQAAAYQQHLTDANIVQVTYEFGYYTITIAGAVSILATACNLLQSSAPPEEVQRHRLIEDLEGPETFSVGMRNIPEPPPPYTP